MGTVKPGWSHPPRLQIDVRDAARTFALEWEQTTRKRTGLLRRSNRVRPVGDGITKAELIASNKQPYAAIQQYGGTIPPFTVMRKAFSGSGRPGMMRWKGRGGGWVFRRSRGPITITPSNAIEKALERTVPKLKVSWAKPGSGGGSAPPGSGGHAA